MTSGDRRARPLDPLSCAAASPRRRWVFGFEAEGRQRVAPSGRLFDGSPLRRTAHAGIVAWWTEVPHARSAESSLAARFEDAAALVESSQRHHAVVASLAADRAFAPCRFGTIYRDAPALWDAVAHDRERIHAVLERVGGADEWSVKGYARRSIGEVEPGTGAIRRFRPGRADRHGRADAGELRRWADSAATVLLDVCRDVIALPPRQPARGGGAGPEVVFSLACLVPRQDRQRFTAALHGLRPEAPERSLRHAGPLPAYGFAALPSAVAAG